MLREGYQYGAAFGAAGLVLGLALAPWTALPLLGAGLFLMFFFRDPERQIPAGPGLMVSPADGRVVDVRDVERDGQACRRVCIFLSPLNVHVNRSPIAGQIREVRYAPGRFHAAWKQEASIENERNTITLETEGGPVVCKQIAGVLARRVVCWKKSGESVARGERIGLMKFSSRMDVMMDPAWEVAVRAGDRVVGGVSVLARWTAPASHREGGGA
jgi:phosphatidylserine decarboxylase